MTANHNSHSSRASSATFIAIVVAILSVAIAPRADAQVSQMQRCIALQQSGGDAATLEYCRGIFAASGYPNGQRDMNAAMTHYEKAAEMGSADAQAVMGVAYERGFQVPKNLALARQWYEKAAAQGYAGAELNLGNMYLNGEGVPRDPEKARQLIQAAANQGLAPAQHALAQLQNGGPAPVPGQDLWAQAKKIYASGDHAGAVPLIQKAAEEGNVTAIYQMGYVYEHADGVTRNYAQAANWYRAAADKGNAEAQASLGNLYEMGEGVPEDWIQAANWYMKAAQQDNELGMFDLGRAYEYGIGVPCDLNTAAGWYDKAAALGNGQAAYFAKYIRDNHGVDGSVRNDQEQAVLPPLIKRIFPPMPPTGRVFHNQAERMAWLRAVAADWAKRRAAMGLP